MIIICGGLVATMGYNLFAGPLYAEWTTLLYLEDPAKTYSAVAPRIGAEPELFRDFAFRVFALMDADDYDAFKPVYKNHGFILRWMPDIGLVRSAHTALEPAYEERREQLNAFQDELEDAFCAKKITVQDGGWPTLRGVHSPAEKVEIKTVEKFWLLLLDVLKRMKSLK